MILVRSTSNDTNHALCFAPLSKSQTIAGEMNTRTVVVEPLSVAGLHLGSGPVTLSQGYSYVFTGDPTKHQLRTRPEIVVESFP